jgi:hypothetical protein
MGVVLGAMVAAGCSSASPPSAAPTASTAPSIAACPTPAGTSDTPPGLPALLEGSIYIWGYAQSVVPTASGVTLQDVTILSPFAATDTAPVSAAALNGTVSVQPDVLANLHPAEGQTILLAFSRTSLEQGHPHVVEAVQIGSDGQVSFPGASCADAPFAVFVAQQGGTSASDLVNELITDPTGDDAAKLAAALGLPAPTGTTPPGANGADAGGQPIAPPAS